MICYNLNKGFYKELSQLFTPETINFLVENRIMNSREWYAEHKEAFRRLVFEPMAELVCEVAPTISAIDPLIVTEPKTDKTISRIYRDTRYSNDKLLYREEMWFSFKRNKHNFPHYPEFFFVIGPNGFSYGCGYYEIKREALDELRRLILLQDPVAMAALDFYAAQNHFTLDGDKYKRSRYPDQPENMRDWLDRRGGICVIHRSKDADLLFSSELGEIIKSQFMLAKPVYELFLLAENAPSDQ